MRGGPRARSNRRVPAEDVQQRHWENSRRRYIHRRATVVLVPGHVHGWLGDDEQHARVYRHVYGAVPGRAAQNAAGDGRDCRQESVAVSAGQKQFGVRGRGVE